MFLVSYFRVINLLFTYKLLNYKTGTNTKYLGTFFKIDIPYSFLLVRYLFLVSCQLIDKTVQERRNYNILCYKNI